jgi:hypothetical protein
VAFEAEWTGGSDTGDIHVTFDDDDNSSARSTSFVGSHFGSGILTFNIRAVIQTPRAYDLRVTGPVNDFKDGIQAMSAVIETYWMPFRFTMNWTFTRPQVKVRFEKGEPFCFFFPVEHGLLEQFNPTYEQIGEDLALEKQLKFAVYRRGLILALKKVRGRDLKLREKDRFLKPFSLGRKS